jgi:hypothetical protein
MTKKAYTYEKVDEILRGAGRAGAIGISAPVRIGFPPVMMFVGAACATRPENPVDSPHPKIVRQSNRQCSFVSLA